MSTYHEKVTSSQTYPNRNNLNPNVESSEVVVVRRQISNGTIAALVISGIIAAALITYLIVSNQQRKQETDLALQQSQQAQSTATDAQARANQQQANSPQPVIVPVPSAQQPVAVPVPVPAPAPAAPTTQSDNRSLDASVANINMETDVTLKLSDDKELVMYALTAKASNGIVTLSGAVPTAELKTKAGDVAKSVSGVKRVINNIVVQ
jgi:type II secretory pathway pseudopilin PulG